MNGDDDLHRTAILNRLRPGQPPARDARSRFYDEMEKLRLLYQQRPDMAPREEVARQQHQAAGESVAPAMLLQALGGRLAPVGGQILRQAMAAREPQKVTGGEIIGGRFVEDPYAAHERRLKGQEFGVRTAESAATHEETLAERARANRAAEADRASAERRHREQLAETRAGRAETRSLAERRFNWEKGKEKYTLVQDKETGQPIGRWNPAAGRLEPLEGGPTPAGVMPAGGPAPGQFPQKPSPKASEDERRISSQVQRIVGSASLMTPEGMKPGAAEATAGLLPGKIGAGAQSAVRGLSGTMGVGEGTRQQTFQSQADIIDSLLYISTGAAYNKEQLEVMREAYMPQYTDNDAALAAKAERLNMLVESAKVRAGRAWTQDAEDALQRAFGGGARQLPAGSMPDVSRGTQKVLPRATAPRGAGASAADYKRRVGL